MNKKKSLLLIIIFISVIPLAGCILNTEDAVTVGSRNNTESIILSNIIGQLIEEKTDIDVQYRENLGGSNVVWNAMMNGSIQIIPDYTGTIVITYYGESPGTAEETLAKTKELVAEDGIRAFGTFGFNNTYTLAFDEAEAEKLGVETFSDFAEVADQYTLGAVFEFIDRPDGLPGFKEEYNLEFKDVKGMDHGMMYRAIDSGEVDVINSYTTDGQLQIYDLRVLEDDRSYFPPYHALPLVREETLKKHPELEEVMQQLEGKIDESAMQAMNAKVDNEGMMVDLVAKEFLQEAGLIE
ncbi:glycine betaine ABC transporter substrate-binding protein [Oceanobacillus rekensis]|uniref:glycine betaine ABC transporter substrate-binding protein n=1 Tax=Oceanobacillus rekensis TaxID=937927 RepID=UPI000B44B09B|nr:glycine betaine ABC transporter substrate-binding protein [Oceanobacillus rekensis]